MVFHDLDASLRALIAAAPAAGVPGLAGATVSFLTPDRAFTPAGPTVNLFLHEVLENRTLRDPRPVEDRSGSTVVRRRAPVQVDCGYLVTAWATTNAGDQRVTAEHHLLGAALTWLCAFPTVPARFLRGSLVTGHAPPTLVAQLDPERHAGDFWTAMGVAPRPSFALTVTVDVPVVPLPAEVDDLVTTLTTDVRSGGSSDLPMIRIGGVVRESLTAAGVADALVELTDLGLRTRTDADGRFRFGPVLPGRHDVRVVAPGFRVAVRTLSIPEPSGDYGVTLVPA